MSRIAAIPVVIGLAYMPGPYNHLLAAGLFLFACLTDFLDGYFARVWQQCSSLGRFLDPIADKLLVAATLLMLVEQNRIAGLAIIPAIIILCREILVSGLREYLAELNVPLPVSRLAKWKTTIQLFAIGSLIIAPGAFSWLPNHEIGIVGLWIAGVLTFITGYDYCKASLQHISNND